MPCLKSREDYRVVSRATLVVSDIRNDGYCEIFGIGHYRLCRSIPMFLELQTLKRGSLSNTEQGANKRSALRRKEM
jgi:uncharacterized phosphosugar-binding protein